MRLSNRLLVVASGLVVLGAGAQCSRSNAAEPADQPPPATRAPSTPATCAMVTAAEMSAIVGVTVTAEPGEGGGTTSCRFLVAGRSTPLVEVSVDWGGGHAAMAAMGMLGRLEPEMPGGRVGLGDEATAIGPALWVRTGEDLVNLQMFGVDDRESAARRIIDTMRPRMGPSSQPRTADADGGRTSGVAGQDDAGAARQAAAMAGSLLEGLLRQGPNDAERRGPPASPARAPGPLAGDGREAIGDEPTYRRVSGSPIRVPLVAGLTLTSATHEPGRGDYEPIVTVTRVGDDEIATEFAAALPEGRRMTVTRRLRRADLERGRGYRFYYWEGDSELLPGTTSFSLSSAILTDLRTTGQAEFSNYEPDDTGLGAITRLFAGLSRELDQSVMKPRTLERVELHAVGVPVLVNDELVELPAVHASVGDGAAATHYYLLDDPDLPIVLRVAGRSSGRMVRIAFPVESAAPAIEAKLKAESRVELHGIYFDFGQATLRPESEPVLREIAAVLGRNPGWSLGIEGHTDNVGGDDYNLDLSRRRAAAVKQALVERYQVPTAALSTTGLGATRPKASNATLPGRAQNRRVELARQ